MLPSAPEADGAAAFVAFPSGHVIYCPFIGFSGFCVTAFDEPTRGNEDDGAEDGLTSVRTSVSAIERSVW